jgi:parallel beta-helix repeat protein
VFVKWGYSPDASHIAGLKIQGFPGAGLCIQSDNNTVEGCVITGNSGDGICIVDGSNNTIGGREPSQANRIYANLGRGVSIKEDSVGDAIPTPSGNAILGNSIYDNGGLGIDLADNDGNFGVTVNRFLGGPPYSDAPEPLDWSDFVNNAQHRPDLESATVGGSTASQVFCRLYGPESKSFRIEVFRNAASDPLGYGEGKELVGWTETSSSFERDTDGSGNGIYHFTVATTTPLKAGDIISATATDDRNNTSEFSAVIYAGVITRIYGPEVK